MKSIGYYTQNGHSRIIFGRGLGLLNIYLKNKINHKKILFYIRYKNVMRLPQKVFKKIRFYDKNIPWH